jgi:hypothetical protein
MKKLFIILMLFSLIGNAQQTDTSFSKLYAPTYLIPDTVKKVKTEWVEYKNDTIFGTIQYDVVGGIVIGDGIIIKHYKFEIYGYNYTPDYIYKQLEYEIGKIKTRDGYIECRNFIFKPFK